jgi:8-oxo-dGTP diphosphatase
MVEHRGLGESGTFWAPPGGGIDFGETAVLALQREMLEETGLLVDVARLLFVYEFIKSPLHAVDLFFELNRAEGALRVGTDPEMKGQDQLIRDVQMMTFEQIKSFPAGDVHGLFTRCETLDEVFALTGYITQI